MAANVTVCNLDPDLEKQVVLLYDINPPLKQLNFCLVFKSFQLEKFRFRRDTSNHAIVMKVTWTSSHQLKTMNAKVDRDSQTVVCDEMLEDLDNIEELRDTLPEHQPRSLWVVLLFVKSFVPGLFKNINSVLK